MDEQERFKKGMEARRRVFGDAHVDRALAARDELTAEFQDLLTRYAWGEIWTRPGLDERTRRMLVLAMLVALGRDAELRMHLAAAFDHGMSREDVKEVLLQTAVYCGLPAANNGFRIAQEVLASRVKQASQSHEDA
jgi:4-carboxymuconolactone decarboxylase